MQTQSNSQKHLKENHLPKPVSKVPSITENRGIEAALFLPICAILTMFNFIVVLFLTLFGPFFKNHFWPFLAGFGSFWPLMAVFGLFWSFLAIFVLFWPVLTVLTVFDNFDQL